MITALCIYTAYNIYLSLTIYILGRGGERSTSECIRQKRIKRRHGYRGTETTGDCDTSCMGTGKFTRVLCKALGVFNQHL